MKMNRTGTLAVFCLTILVTGMAGAQPADPDPLQFWLTEASAGNDDLIGANSGAVTGEDWVYVYADANRITLLATAQSAADGSIAEFSIGDGATIDGVILNDQQENDVYLFAWDGVEWSTGHITLENDVLGPVLISASTRDTDSDGAIDLTSLIFNEAIIDVAASDSVVLANITIADSSCTSFDTGSSDNDNICEYSISDDAREVPGTGAGVVAFNDVDSGGITDALGNETLSSSLLADDQALPLMFECSYRDDDSDGTVETVTLIWSEEVTFSWDEGDWVFEDNEDLQLEFGSWTHSADTTVFTIQADTLETGCDDNGDPTISYTNNADRVVDLAPIGNNAPSSSIDITDRAAPWCSDYYYHCTDWETFNFVSRVDLVWTENISGDATGDYWVMSDTVLNLEILEIVWDDPANQLQFTVSGDEYETGCNGAPEPVVSFDGDDQLQDAAGNVPDYNGSTLRDLALPQQYYRVYLDENIDGMVETIQVEYSENIEFSWQTVDWALENNNDLNLEFSSAVVENSTLFFTMAADSNETGCNNHGNPFLTYTNHNDLIRDTSPQNNIAPSTSPAELVDGAAPFCRLDTGRYTDVNASGTVDRADINLTEDLFGFTFFEDDWVIDGGDIGLELNFAVVISHGNILFAVEGDFCETGVDNETGIEPTITYIPNLPLILHDEAGNCSGGFIRTLNDEAVPVFIDCASNPLVYSDDDHDGQVDHVSLRLTEQVFCDSAGDIWEIEFPSVNSNPIPSVIEGSGSNQLSLSGFSLTDNLTYLEDATLALTSGNVVADNNGNLLHTFPATPLFDEACPVAFIATAALNPIPLHERQHLDIVFTEMVVENGSLDPDVSYMTGGPIQRNVLCSTAPGWETFQHPEFPAIHQSWFSVDADELIGLGESGPALITVVDAVDENGNVMAESPPYPQEYTFAVDARALILVTEPDISEIEAGVEFMIQVEAMDSSASQRDLFYNELILFSSNLSPEQIILPEGAVALLNGLGEYPVTVLEPTAELHLYVHEEGDRIDNIDNGDGPYMVFEPAIDAPHAGWSEDSPDDQGNFIDFQCELSANDPASDEFDAEAVGYNTVREYRWYRDEGEFLTLVAQTEQRDSIDLVFEHYDTAGDTTTWTYYVAAWSDGSVSETVLGGNAGKLVTKPRMNSTAGAHSPAVYHRIGNPQAVTGDRIQICVDGHPELAARDADYSSSLVQAGTARSYDNIPPQAVGQFSVTQDGEYSLLFEWEQVAHGINDSLEINPVYYHLYRGTTVNTIDELISSSTDIGYIDADVVGNPETNYFYHISAHDWDNESELSLILGEYDYHIRSAEGTDWNFIGLSMQTGLTVASELIDTIIGSNGAADWVADQQGWDSFAPLRSDFSLEDGHAYLINYPDGETVYTVIGEPVLDVNFQLVTTSATDWNDITLPLTENGVTSLGDLIDAIDQVDAAALFDNQAQSWYVFYEDFPEGWDRDITPGQAVLVNVTAPGSWPDTELNRGLGELIVDNRATDAPHLVWGNLYGADGSTVEGETAVTAYVVGREDDRLTSTDPAVRVSEGVFALQVGDFNHDWQAGETVRLEFQDDLGFQAVCEVELSWAGADYGGSFTLTEIPSEWALYQNYPNPFNPTTVIPFDLAERAAVEIAVYDLMGQRVALVEDGVLPAGHHEISWNGSNTTGDQVASGVYFVQMRTVEFVATRKMVKVK
jgi:hypothetical protein